MKLIKLLFFILISQTLYAQEICNNGIDDDGDLLIDIADTSECNCVISGSGGGVTSLIPNPSFELYNNLPTGHSQLYECSGWIQATFATSDYLNNLSFNWGVPINPPPDGNGYIGFHIIQASGYLEYVGACLTSTIVAGESYTVKFDIAAYPINGFDALVHDTANLDNTSIDITIYGNPSCAALPVATSENPTSVDPTWIELGHINYIPKPYWSLIQIDFTPTANMNAIMIGGPLLSAIPAGFDAAFGTGLPYFFADNLIVNETALFGANTVNITAPNCFENNVTLVANSSNNSNIFVWSTSQIGDSITVTNSGTYIVTATDTSGCVAKDTVRIGKYPVISLPNFPPCTINPVNISLSSTESINTYAWSFPTATPSTSSSANPIVDFNIAGINNLSVIATTVDGCSDTATSSVYILDTSGFYIPNILVKTSTAGNNVFDFNNIVQDFNTCVEYELLIYDRWGVKVFEQKNQTVNPDLNCDACFRGKTNSNAELSQGVYYYVFKMKEDERRGFIEIFE